MKLNAWITEIISKRRDKLCIVAEILEITKGGTAKTQIMQKANLNFAQLNEYLNFMLEAKLIEKNARQTKQIYITTEKGFDFLQLQCDLAELLKPEYEKTTNTKSPRARLLIKG